MFKLTSIKFITVITLEMLSNLTMTVLSSANKRDVKDSGRKESSLMYWYSINSKGPSIYPCATPHNINLWSDCEPF